MSLSCPVIQTIASSECIGNSLVKITDNFTALKESACSKVDRSGDIMTGDLDLSNNELKRFTVVVKEITVTPSQPTYTLQASDCGAVLNVTCTTNGYISVPPNLLPIGFNCMIVNKSTNSLTITQPGGVTINNTYQKITLGTQWGICNLIVLQTNRVLISGDLT